MQRHLFNAVAIALRRFPALEAVPIHVLRVAAAPTRTLAYVVAGRPQERRANQAPALTPGLRRVCALVEETVGEDPAGPVQSASVRWSVAEGRALVTLRARGKRLSQAAEELAAVLGRSPLVAGVVTRDRSERGAPLFRLLVGRPYVIDRAAGALVRISGGSFAPRAPRVRARTVSLLRGHLLSAGVGRHLLDLYCGTGALALALRDCAATVTGVDSNGVEDALSSVALSGSPDGVRFVHARAEEFCREGLHAAEPRPDRVTLEPPAAGAMTPVLTALALLRPQRAAYVSSDATSLARDLAVLALHGLTAEGVWVLGTHGEDTPEQLVALMVPGPPTALQILWRNDDVLAVAKPATLPTDFPPGRSLVDRIRALPGCADFSPAHRLDAGTSGVVLFARGAPLRALGAAFAAGAVAKEYLALVRGVPHARGRIDRPLADRSKGPPARARKRPRMRDAVTGYRTQEVVAGHALLNVFPETGRAHQIRRHLEGIGHPVVGDTRYGALETNRYFLRNFRLARPFLHAAALELDAAVLGDAAGGERLRIECPLPPELEQLLSQLRDSAT